MAVQRLRSGVSETKPEFILVLGNRLFLFFVDLLDPLFSGFRPDSGRRSLK
jgi:hypothetical protein